MMDCASGISAERAERYRASPERRLLGDINREYEHLCAAWNAPDVGEEFRAPVTVDVPTLIVHGTWDTKTPIENAREVASGLPDCQLVVVEGGGHGALANLCEHEPGERELLHAFLAGRTVEFPSTVTLGPVEFAPFEFDPGEPGR